MRLPLSVAAALLVLLALIMGVDLWPDRRLKENSLGHSPNPLAEGAIDHGRPLGSESSVISLDGPFAQSGGRNDTFSIYLRAFDALPAFTPAEEELLVDRTPDRDAEKALASRLTGALQIVHEATSLRTADWGLPPKPTLPQTMARLGVARFGQLLALRAHVRLEDGDMAGAQADLSDLLALSRQIDQLQDPNGFATALSQRQLVARAIEKALPVLDEGQAVGMASFLQSAGPVPLARPIVIDVLEKRIAWMQSTIPKQQASGTFTYGSTVLPTEAKAKDSPFSALAATPRAIVRDADHLATMTGRLRQYGEEYAALADLPHAVYEPAYADLETRIKADPDGILAEVFVVGFTKYMNYRGRSENVTVREAMVRAALAYRTGDIESFQQQVAVIDLPVKTVNTPTGVELRSEDGYVVKVDAVKP